MRREKAKSYLRSKDGWSEAIPIAHEYRR